MRVKNTTTIPSNLVREIIQFVRPSGISNFDVMVKNGEHLVGKAYYKGSGYHSTADPFIVCRVPQETRIRKIHQTIVSKTQFEGGISVINQEINNFPCKLLTYQIGHLKGRRYWLADRIEALVYLIAHELRHLWQAKMKNKKGYYPKSRGRFSEIDTEGYAITMLRAWRKRGD